MPSSTIQIAANAGDATQASVGSATVTTGISLSVSSGSPILVGLRFIVAGIPKNALIVTATLQVNFENGTKNDDVDVVIYGQATGTAANFATGADNIYSRTKTSASVAWSGTALAAGGTLVTSPELKTVIQEIVNNSGWATTSRGLALIIDSSSVSNSFVWSSYDGTPSSAATLTIVYDTVLATGIASTNAFGGPALTPGAVSLSPTGIATTNAFGTPTLSVGAKVITPTGIASTAALGAPSLTPGAVVLSLSGIGSVAAVGTPAVTTGAVSLSVTGIAPTSALGSPVLSIAGVVSPTGLGSTAVIGVPSLVPGTVTVTATGIASGTAFGTVTVVVIAPPQPDLNPYYVVIRERMITNTYEKAVKPLREKGHTVK